jgi:hypothetical protein
MSTNCKLFLSLVCLAFACEKKADKQLSQPSDSIVESMKSLPSIGLLNQEWQTFVSLDGCDAQSPTCSYVAINGLTFQDTTPIPNSELLNQAQKTLIAGILDLSQSQSDWKSLAQEYLRLQKSVVQRRFRFAIAHQTKFTISIVLYDSLRQNDNWLTVLHYRTIALSSATFLELHQIIDMQKFAEFAKLVEREANKIFPKQVTPTLTHNFHLSENGITFCYGLDNKSSEPITYLTLSYQQLSPFLSQNGKVLTIP